MADEWRIDHFSRDLMGCISQSIGGDVGLPNSLRACVSRPGGGLTGVPEDSIVNEKSATCGPACVPVAAEGCSIQDRSVYSFVGAIAPGKRLVVGRVVSALKPSAFSVGHGPGSHCISGQ